MENLEQFVRVMGGFQELNNVKNDKITPEISEQIKALVEYYRKPTMEVGDALISVFMSVLYGYINIGRCTDDKTIELTYPEESQHIDFKGSMKVIYFGTVDTSVEPYNKQGELYVGYRYSDMELVKQTELQRIYKKEMKQYNLFFSLKTFHYNEYWNTVQFGLCIPYEKIDEFLSKYYQLLSIELE